MSTVSLANRYDLFGLYAAQFPECERVDQLSISGNEPLRAVTVRAESNTSAKTSYNASSTTIESVATSASPEPLLLTRVRSSVTSTGIFSVGYQLIDATIVAMAASDDEETHIDQDIATSAIRVAAELSKSNLPPPEILRHGPRSAVFSWTVRENALYVTVSAQKISVLATDTKGVLGKTTYNLASIGTPHQFLTVPLLSGK